MLNGKPHHSPHAWIAGIALLAAQAAHGMLWPMGDGMTHQPIYSTYGQYYESSGGLHLHEGLDVLGPQGTSVYARASGTIVGLDKGSGLIILETNQYTHTGLNYSHVNPGSRPPGNNGPTDPGGPWKEGDFVKMNDTLGTVMTVLGHPPHLHVDIGSGTDPYFSSYPPPKNMVRQPTLDPLESFYPPWSTNNPAPVVSDDIKFRIADHDRNGVLTHYQIGPLENLRHDNLYFDKTVNGTLVVGRRSTTRAADGSTGGGTANIDIIAMAYDLATPGGDLGSGTRNAPMSVALRIQRQQSGADTGLHTIYEFAGMYLQEEWVHGYTHMRDPDARWIRTIYSNDATTDSHDVTAELPELRGTYWFQMTNYDGDTLVEVGPPLSPLDDRGRYWNSDGRVGNDFYTIPGVDPVVGDALSNAQSEFADGFYDITVVAKDHGGLTGSATRTIVLDNWLQELKPTKSFYQVADYVGFYGEQFTANATIALYLLTEPPEDGQELRDPWDSARTDPEGYFEAVELGSLRTLGVYYVVADYDGDGIYYSPLDALASFKVVPEPASLALICLGIGVSSRRRRRGLHPRS